MKCLFLFIPAVGVGLFVDPCNVTHQGKATTYNISNPKSNPTCGYTWVDFKEVLATAEEPNNGGTSSSHRSLTLLGCRKNVSVMTNCPPKHYRTFCLLPNCPAAPEPQANFTAAPEPPEHIDPIINSSLALAVVLTPGGIAWTVVGTVGVIAMVIAVVIALICCRRKENSLFERFKRACSSNEPQSGRGADGRPEDTPMLDV
ncbi:uncharacterized protein LOC132461072 [Gadus macrocephalus]|uniref:uncharacterized protein LOC132461072 n=1 Tax=Gadus macrocephalus TaxID=80720 RepID=UPI0028CB7D69|nr:uncharacterized protein LOC132461072 [Gadus macrocephalus]